MAFVLPKRVFEKASRKPSAKHTIDKSLGKSLELKKDRARCSQKAIENTCQRSSPLSKRSSLKKYFLRSGAMSARLR
jgi:hypothetical protein